MSFWSPNLRQWLTVASFWPSLLLLLQLLFPSPLIQLLMLTVLLLKKVATLLLTFLKFEIVFI